MNTPIQSHLLKAVATYLSQRKQDEKPAEAEVLLETLFFQHTLILVAINATPELAEQVRGEMAAAVERMKDTAPAPEPSNIIVPDGFRP
jgi:hypothetical protein